MESRDMLLSRTLRNMSVVRSGSKDFTRSESVTRVDLDRVKEVFNFTLGLLTVKEFCLNDAILLCKCGCFVKHVLFDAEQSMHAFEGKLYYEDGACLSDEFLETLEEAYKYGWSIKYLPSQVDTHSLYTKHKFANGMMLRQGKSYEDCVNK